MFERRCFVQFIHPGGEHEPDDRDLKSWNCGQHRRKFLKVPGRYLERSHIKDGPIVFWGEWEPESRVVARYDRASPDAPHFLYEPFFVDHRDSAPRQNTDPFVFGARFQYTGCLQHTRRGATQMRFLAPGSLILFGSCRDESRFVVDTVLVVASFVDHSANDWRRKLKGRVSPTYRAVTLEPWYRAPLPAGQTHRLYFGATAENPVAGMFSFFPCRPYRVDSDGFTRPEIRIPELITPQLKQGKKITRDLHLGQMTAIWREVVQQVEGGGLLLATFAELPSKLSSTVPSIASRRAFDRLRPARCR